MKNNINLFKNGILALLVVLVFISSGTLKVLFAFLVLLCLPLFCLPFSFRKVFFKYENRIKNKIYEEKRKENAEKQMTEIRETPVVKQKFVIPDVDEYSQHKVLLHLTRRVTEHLKQIFPEAHWSFTDSTDVSDMLGGVPFRIKVYDAGGWNFADVIFGNKAEVQINMLKLAPLASSGTFTPQTSNVQIEDALTWFENYGSKKIMEFYVDASARGWNCFFIDPTGKAFFLENSKENLVGKLDQLPAEKEWDLLCQYLLQDNITAMPMDGMLKIIVNQ